MKYLVENGANVNVKSKSNTYDSDYETPIQKAAQFGHLSIVKYLVENGAKIADDPELIPEAADGWLEPGYLKIVQYLHENGADINSRSPLGNTGLKQAANGGNFPLVKYFVDQGADINTRGDSGYSALDVANFERGTLEGEKIIAYLLQHGARCFKNC